MENSFPIGIEAGITTKWKLFGDYYFVPSVNIYEHYYFNKIDWDAYSENMISIGPDIEFEYMPNDKISMSLSVISFSYGLNSFSSHGLDPYSGSYSNSFWTSQLHKFIGFSLNCNF